MSEDVSYIMVSVVVVSGVMPGKYSSEQEAWGQGSQNIYQIKKILLWLVAGGTLCIGLFAYPNLVFKPISAWPAGRTLNPEPHFLPLGRLGVDPFYA